MDKLFDVAIIGGGINGAGIARDAAGRGLAPVLIESGDFGGATSAASSKLLHGGLRYLEMGEYRLVRTALQERRRLIDAAPHLAHPQSFILPRQPGPRPDWKVRAGLFLYDHLGPRGGMPATRGIELLTDRAGRGILPAIRRAWRYWDGWIDDSRMVIATLRDAEQRGAVLIGHDPAVSGQGDDDGWRLTLASGRQVRARRVVNAAGPWAEHVARDVLGLGDPPRLRLVRGTHIVVVRPTSAEDAYILPQPDGRVVFMIPWLKRHLMIGTTEVEATSPDDATPDQAEEDYLIAAANRALARPLDRGDIVHRFAGIRPLVLEEGVSATETSREWRLHQHGDARVLSVVGGKITTYRRLAEAVLAEIAPRSKPWTAGSALPGGGFAGGRARSNHVVFVESMDRVPELWPLHDPSLVRRFLQRFGTEAVPMLGRGPGPRVGPFYECELIHFVTHEYARTPGDVLWRRTQEGLTATAQDVAAVERWFGFTGS
jgi:glycerol-3-phosphate dehydrogenase